MNLMTFLVFVMHKTFMLFSLIPLHVYRSELRCLIHSMRIYFSHKRQIQAEILRLPSIYHECLISLVKTQIENVVFFFIIIQCNYIFRIILKPWRIFQLNMNSHLILQGDEFWTQDVNFCPEIPSCACILVFLTMNFFFLECTFYSSLKFGCKIS